MFNVGQVPPTRRRKSSASWAGQKPALLFFKPALRLPSPSATLAWAATLKGALAGLPWSPAARVVTGPHLPCHETRNFPTTLTHCLSTTTSRFPPALLVKVEISYL